ncbi:NAD-dependent protein deacetylase Sir2B-like [Aphis craccivora]|uniref:NAD-dependent protein deacetylase Sir2B-like n=1 Tax=Aphis craccivora TaxID=307492 RepID=A0A6G0VXG0_APHCR|nr:NAD-dependent protein deacetylase Sir2B-like [Aphis craccivora]
MYCYFDISGLSSFDDTMGVSDYEFPNSPIEVSDFENMSEYEELLRKHVEETNNTYSVDDGVRVTEDSDENITVPRGKKKTKNINNWKRNKCKNANASGVEHYSSWETHFTEKNRARFDEEKQKILSCFNQIGNKEKQDTYIAGLIKINDVVRHRPKNNTKPKSCTCIYKVRINHVEKVVCKKSFCSFFGVGKSRVERIVKLLQKNIPSPVDRRGKHRNRGNAKDDQILFQIDTHIQSFPSRQSHYSRSKNDEVRYLSPDLNVSKMYNLYLMKYESDTWELMKNKNNSIKPTVPIIFIEIVSIQILSCLLGIHAPTHVKLAIH